jgi:hypothetical protein
MLNKTIPKNHTVIPNGMSEAVDTSESEDEMNKIQNILKNQLAVNNNSSSSSSESSDAEEKLEQDTSKSKSKKKKRIHWVKKKPLYLQYQHLSEVYHHYLQ